MSALMALAPPGQVSFILDPQAEGELSPKPSHTRSTIREGGKRCGTGGTWLSIRVRVVDAAETAVTISTREQLGRGRP